MRYRKPAPYQPTPEALARQNNGVDALRNGAFLQGEQSAGNAVAADPDFASHMRDWQKPIQNSITRIKQKTSYCESARWFPIAPSSPAWTALSDGNQCHGNERLF